MSDCFFEVILKFFIFNVAEGRGDLPAESRQAEFFDERCDRQGKRGGPQIICVCHSHNTDMKLY